MENIINVAFADRKTAYAEGLTQWDKGFCSKLCEIDKVTAELTNQIGNIETMLGGI